MNPAEVLKKYPNFEKDFSIHEFGVGATNTTYRVDRGGELFILQKMHAVFSRELIEDIDTVTKHLAGQGILTGQVIRTLDGRLFVEDADSWWRMFTYVTGNIFTAIEGEQMAESAGRLIGTWHQALANLEYDFKFQIPDFHNVELTLEKLAEILIECVHDAKYESLKPLALNVLKDYKSLPKIDNLPIRIIHGDLKISNVVFDENGEAVSIIDLDTFMHSTIAIEMGDALRSWCMPGGEDTDYVRFDRGIYDAALKGYFETAEFLTEEEKASIPYGVKLITLELTARFIIDAFTESYFKLNSSYPSLYEQNKKRAENQYAFFQSFSEAEM